MQGEINFPALHTSTCVQQTVTNTRGPPYSILLLIILNPMLSPSPSARKMVKDAPNNTPDNIVGQAQNPREIHEDSDISILPEVLINPTCMVLNNRYKVGIILYAFCTEVIIIWICYAHSVTVCDPHPHDQRYVNIIPISYTDLYKNCRVTQFKRVRTQTLTDI